MRAPFSLLSKVQIFIVLMMPYAGYLIVYKQYIGCVNKEASVNLGFLADATAQSKLTQYLAERTFLMDFELEVVKFIEEKHPIYSTVLPKLKSASKELGVVIKDVHNFVQKYDEAKTPSKYIQCFRNETWDKVQEIDRLLNMTLEFERLRMLHLERISERVREIVRAAQCGTRFPQMLAIFPKLDGNDWNAQKINHVTMVQNDTYTDILALKKLLKIYKEHPASCIVHFITTDDLEFDIIRQNIECNIYSNTTEWLNEVYDIYYKYQAELELYDYNIQRSIFRINRLTDRLKQRELTIWSNEVLPLVHQLQMKTKLGLDPLFKLNRGN